MPRSKFALVRHCALANTLCCAVLASVAETGPGTVWSRVQPPLAVTRQANIFSYE